MVSDEDLASKVTPGMVRKLAAILSADVAEYSRLMEADEEATIHTLTVYRAAIATLVQHHGGRVVDAPGDNLLAEFASVLDAVQCAVAIQRELHTRNTALPPQRRMHFRLGLNLGDVIADGERLYGDGVNIAARLESLAEAGGICLSGTVYDQIATKLALAYEFVGERAVKNIARPVRVYRVGPEAGAPGRTGRLRPRLGARPWPRGVVGVVALLLLVGGVASWWLVGPPIWLMSWPDKPSIAVLPFVNMSGDAAQEYFSDGMTEDLITDLARLAGLLVIARNSVYTYKGKEVKPAQVRQELGVRYMVEGSVRRAEDRVRITAQLIDTRTGYHLWAERYDRDLQDIFAVQAEIARRITRALAMQLTPEEEANMEQKYTNSVEAWDYFLQGTALYRQYTKEANAEARRLFKKAIDLDPEFARAYATLSATHRQDGTLGWTEDPEASKELAYRIAQKAVELARREPEPKPSLPHTLEQAAYIRSYRREYQEAIEAAKEAVTLNPNYADGYTVWAHALIYWGKPEEAISKTREAMSRNPKIPFFYDYHLGQAYYVWGFLTEKTDVDASRRYYQQAEGHLRESLRKNKNFRPARSYLVAVLSELGRQDEAVEEMAILRDAGRPQAVQDLKRFQAYVQRTAVYENSAITTRLSELWQAAESRP